MPTRLNISFKTFHSRILGVALLISWILAWEIIPSTTYHNIVPILSPTDMKGVEVMTSIREAVPLWAFDNKFYGEVFHSAAGVTTGTITIHLPKPEMVARVGFSPQTDIISRLPRDFRIESSNDGESWKELGFIAGADYTGITTGHFKSFKITGSRPFPYYRIIVLANSGDSYLTFSELRLEKTINNIWLKIRICLYLGCIFLCLSSLLLRQKKDTAARPVTADILYITLFFLLTSLFFVPFSIYTRNIAEFGLTNSVSLLLLLTTTLAFATPTFLTLRMLKTINLNITLTIFLCVGVLIWLQAYPIGWGHGALDGSRLDLSGMRQNYIHDLLLWLSVIFLGVTFCDSIIKLAPRLAIIFTLVQTAALARSFKAIPSQPQAALSNINTPEMFRFSRNTRNIIIIVLDMFQSDIFSDILKNGTNPALTTFQGFTYFPNATASFPVTIASVPNFLTGIPYDNKISHQDYLKEAFTNHSLFKYATEAGHKVSALPWLANELFLPGYISQSATTTLNLKESVYQLSRLYDSALFLEVPHSIKPRIYNDGRWLISRWALKAMWGRINTGITIPANTKARDIIFANTFKKRAWADTSSPTFKFYHLTGNHVPLDMDENFQAVKMEFNHENSIRQGNGAIKLAGIILTKLKDIGAYDNSLIFVISDHGSGEETTPASGPGVSGWLARGIPLILVKQPGVTGKIEIRSSPVALSDIPPTATAFSELSGKFDGENMFKVPENSQRKRYFTNPSTGNLFEDRFEQLEYYEVSGNSWKKASWRKMPRPTN